MILYASFIRGLARSLMRASGRRIQQGLPPLFLFLTLVQSLSLIVVIPITASPSDEMPSFFSLLSSEQISSGYGQGCEAERTNATLRFTESKRVLRTLFLSLSVRTLYCNCRFTLEGHDLKVDPESCGFEPRQKQGYAVNWEHIVPASRFGHERECWKGKGCGTGRGRRCCQRIDICFNRMEGDLHNLAPALTELNYDRGNFSYGEIPGEDRRYGRCDFEVDLRRRIAEPREEIRGDLARAYLYMAWRYGFELSDAEKTRFLRWNLEDPPDEMERRLEAARRRLQGNGNPFISGWKNPTS